MTFPITPPPAIQNEINKFGGKVINAVPGVETADAIADGVSAVRRWIADRHNWIRVIWTVSGFALMIGGAMVISRPVARAGKVTSTLVTGTVGKAVKGGK